MNLLLSEKIHFIYIFSLKEIYYKILSKTKSATNITNTDYSICDLFLPSKAM